MSRWATIPLRRIIHCLDGQRVPLNSEERSEMSGPYSYWGANGIVGHVDRYLFDEVLVLLGEDGAPFGDPTRDVAFLVVEPVWVNNHIHVLRPKPDINARFLTYALNCVDWVPLISGSTRDKLTQNDMLVAPIPCPPLGEQRQIAEYLDAETARIDALIAKKQEMIALVMEEEQRLLLDAMGDWRFVRVWSLRQAGTTVVTGPFGTQLAASEYVTGGAPVINPTHIVRGTIMPDSDITVSEEVATRLARHRLRPGDIVLGRKGDVGRCAVITYEQDGWICGSDSIAVRTDRTKLHPAFLGVVLHLSLYRQQLNSFSTGATLANVNEGTLLGLRVPQFSLSEQEGIVKRATRIMKRDERLVTGLQAQIRLLIEHRQALITAAVTGQLEVSEVAA